MNAAPRVRALVVGFVVVVSGGMTSATAQDETSVPRDPVEHGRELFEHRWSPGDKLSPLGDGLGPMYNDVSCAACHAQGAVGGAGPAANNVDLLSVVRPNIKSPADRQKFSERLHRIHPGLTPAGAAIVLHRFGSADDYDDFKGKLFFKRRGDHLAPVREYAGLARVNFRVSQRNTPALFGDGLIDSISDEVLVALAKEQPRRNPLITGRVGRTASGSVGRFGWRGQTGTLREFVLSACAAELGLEVARHSQSVQATNPDYKSPGVDLDDEQCDALVQFVANLPQPRQEMPDHLVAEIESGQQLFKSSGCTACHVEQLAQVRGIYSDLLLHDMGGELADPVPATPETAVRTVSSGSYYGGTVDVFVEVPSEIRQEWRTPPLWGVRDSAPYLHDGRATSLAAAIALHGGEAKQSADRFASLPKPHQARVVRFLQSLRAPLALSVPDAGLASSR